MSTVVKDRTTKSRAESRNVRVIAKVRAFTEAETEFRKGNPTLPPWISVQRQNDELAEKAIISFGDQLPTSRKEAFEVDYCYEQHEDNRLIFEREIKPLIAKLFDGVNSSIIAYGARGSGKTYTIQGSDEQLGLAGLAIAEILLRAEETGKIVKVSYFEVYNDRAFDLLDPKVQEVQALKDAQGKIQLRGLSQVQVKSLPEFKKMYFDNSDLRKATQNTLELTQRSHKGLILYLSSLDEHSKTNIVGKMNFVDLAGYEDTRRKTIGGSEIFDNARMNKTLYALQNVVHALNAKEIHVPYRESKLTRMLQDSLGGPNSILMLTCLNPSFCQDTIYMASLAYRSYQGINRLSMDSTKKVNSAARPAIPSSTKKILNYGTVSASVKKKQTSSRLPLSEKKFNGPGSEVRGRRLFQEANQRNTKQVSSLSKSSVKVSKPKLRKEEESVSDPSKAVTLKEEEIPQSLNTKDTEHSDILEKEESVSDLSKSITCTEEEILQSLDIKDTDCSDITEKEILQSLDIKDTDCSDITEKEILQSLDIKDTDCSDIIEKVVSPYTEKDHLQSSNVSNNLSEVTYLSEEGLILKENKNSSLSQEISPPISARLQELSSSMKLFSQEKSSHMKSVLSSAPLCITMPQASPLCITMPQVSTGMMEPNTPVPAQNLRRGVSNIPMPQASPLCIMTPQASTDIMEPKTPVPDQNLRWGVSKITSPQSSYNMANTGVKDSLVKEHLKFLNSANKEELKRLKGIGEKRAAYIVRLREDSPEYFKELDDLKDIGLSANQIKGMMKKAVGDLFS